MMNIKETKFEVEVGQHFADVWLVHIHQFILQIKRVD